MPIARGTYTYITNQHFCTDIRHIHIVVVFSVICGTDYRKNIASADIYHFVRNVPFGNGCAFVDSEIFNLAGEENKYRFLLRVAWNHKIVQRYA